MFAIRHKKTGKFLKAFNGSFNHASFGVQCDIAEEMLGGKKKANEARKQNGMAVVNKLDEVKWQDIVARMWCLKTPNNAQLYKSESAVVASIGDGDWYEIVPVVITVKRGHGKAPRVTDKDVARAMAEMKAEGKC